MKTRIAPQRDRRALLPFAIIGPQGNWLWPWRRWQAGLGVGVIRSPVNQSSFGSPPWGRWYHLRCLLRAW